MRHHLDEQPESLEKTVEALRENIYVDNVIQVGSDLLELQEFKELQGKQSKYWEEQNLLFTSGNPTWRFWKVKE